MAIQDNDGFLRGKKGDSIYRRLYGKTVISQAPNKREQTDKSRSTAFEFGLASNTARAVRLPLGLYYLGLDGSLVNRLNTAFREALSLAPKAERGNRDIHDTDLSPLRGLQFNKHAPLNKIMKVRPFVEVLDNGTFTVKVPEFSSAKDLSYPRTGFHMHCCIRVSQYAFDFRNEFYVNMGSRETEITQPVFEGFDWNFDECLPPGSLVMACMSLRFYLQSAAGEKKELNIREFSPAEIIAAYHIPRLPAAEAFGWQDNYLPLEGYDGNEKLRNNDPGWKW